MNLNHKTVSPSRKRCKMEREVKRCELYFELTIFRSIINLLKYTHKIEKRRGIRYGWY